MSDAKKAAPFVNRFGILSNVQMKKARNGKPYVSAVLTSIPKSGKAFETVFTAFNQKVIDAIKAAGNGNFISLRGPLEDRQMDGGKYTQSQFTPVMINTKKEDADKAPAAESQTTGAEASIDDQIPF